VDPAEFVAALPEVEARADVGIELDAYVLRAGRTRLRLVLAYIALVVGTDDVADVELLGEEGESNLALPARVRLRTGARLMEVGPSDPYLELCGGHRPFAFVVRPDVPVLHLSERFRSLERSFLHERGLPAPGDR
jgi:hypothetical protein